MQYGSTTKPYLLTHLRSTVAAQQASQQAHAMLPAKLRPYADFYISHDVTRRQAALDSVLMHLQEALQLQYNVMWTSEAVSMLVFKVRASLMLACGPAATVYMCGVVLKHVLCISAALLL